MTTSIDYQKYLEASFLGSEGSQELLPNTKLPEGPMYANLARDLIKHFRLNEAKANQNLATFCTTQMEEQADALILDSLNTNAIDKSEYPKTAALENACISMIAHLWNIGDSKKLNKDFIGTSTVGSSEGCMLEVWPF